MASFTKKVFGLAGIATVFAGMSFAAPSTCTAGAPQTNIIRAEGTAEQVGNLVISCAGGGLAGTGSLQVFLSPSLPVTSRVLATGGSETEAVAVVGAGAPVSGVVSGSTINFSNLILPAGNFTITVSNVRINATSLSVGAGVPPSVSATAFITGSDTSIIPAVIASTQVAFVQNGLGATGVFKALNGTDAGVSKNFVNCVAESGTLAGSFRVNENFAQAFKTAAGEANTVTIAGPSTPISTRIKVSLANVPAGVTVLLPLTVTSSQGNAVLTWVTSDTGSTAATSDNNANGGPIAATSRAVALTSGAGSVTYSVTTQDLANLDKFDIGVYVVTANNGVTSSSTPFTMSASLAPVGSATAVPNFAVGASTTTTTMNTFSQCSTSLLFPFVTNQLGFDTGIAISNTSSDPFAKKGAAPQAGTCSLNFYGAGAPSPANVTTPNVPTGTTYTQVLSGVAAGFQGYMIALCNFQYAHGFAFITNGVGANGGLSQGYLAGVIPDVNQVNRASGTGETLGN